MEAGPSGGQMYQAPGIIMSTFCIGDIYWDSPLLTYVFKCYLTKSITVVVNRDVKVDSVGKVKV